MSRFKYKFEKYDQDRIPLIEVQIKNKSNNNVLGYRALLDSGATMCIFHSEIANLLGIDLTKIKETVEFSGVGKAKSSLKGKRCIVELMIFQKGKRHTFDAYVVFSEDIGDKLALLGRMGFFNQFDKVIFDLENEDIYLDLDN